MLAQAHMPLIFWAEDFFSAAYLINRLPTPMLNFESPFQCLFHSLLDYNLLKVFGTSCFPLLRPDQCHKLSFRSSKCLFLGYSPHYKGYRCLHPSGRIYISRSYTFNGTEFPYSSSFPSTNSSLSSGLLVQFTFPLMHIKSHVTQQPLLGLFLFVLLNLLLCLPLVFLRSLS